MKKINRVVLLVFSSIVVLAILTGCENDIEKEENKISTEENADAEMNEKTQEEGMEETEETEEKEEKDEAEIKKETGENVETNYETMLLRDQKISDMVKSMDEIKEAEVGTYENNTLIAIVLQDDVDELNDELKEKITQEVKAVDDSLENVKITEDENIKEELKNTKESMKSEDMSEDLESKIKELFEGIE